MAFLITRWVARSFRWAIALRRSRVAESSVMPKVVDDMSSSRVAVSATLHRWGVPAWQWKIRDGDTTRIQGALADLGHKGGLAREAVHGVNVMPAILMILAYCATSLLNISWVCCGLLIKGSAPCAASTSIVSRWVRMTAMSLATRS